jgi:hypothetical protein
MTDNRVRKQMAELQPPGPLVDTYQLYIDGGWVEPGDGRYDDLDPATERIIASAPDASVAQVAEAIAAARCAFDDGPWADMGPEDRAGCLFTKQLVRPNSPNSLYSNSSLRYP